jgi:HisA/HisF family protein
MLHIAPWLKIYSSSCGLHVRGEVLMEVIPVLDLKGGVVVRARMGERDLYRPIETPLAATSDPLDVARGLLSVWPFTTLYVADLDAIERKGDNGAVLTRLRAACPGLSLWVDNGIAEAAAAARWLDRGWGRLVLGSETQSDLSVVRGFADDDRVILSLDFRGSALQGPPELLSRAAAWPTRVIVMTLARVGSGAGPDVERLAAVRAMAPGRKIYAAGGVRDADDLMALARAGIAGALVATSLHDGRLRRADIDRLAAETASDRRDAL